MERNDSLISLSSNCSGVWRFVCLSSVAARSKAPLLLCCLEGRGARESCRLSGAMMPYGLGDCAGRLTILDKNRLKLNLHNCGEITWYGLDALSGSDMRRICLYLAEVLVLARDAAL